MEARKILRGRCLSLTQDSVTLAIDGSVHKVSLSGPAIGLHPGDWIEVSPTGVARLLTPNRTPSRSTEWMSRIQDPRRRHAMRVRARVESAIRSHLESQGYLETRTPLLVPSPGMEPHIRPFRLETGVYLPTSPEFAMKRLLAGGLERIFQIAPSFRLEPNSTTHHPEFTMLEFYRAFADDEALRVEVERLFAAVARAITGREEFVLGGQRISVAPPWPRLRVRDLFQDVAGVDLVACATADQLAAECRRLGLAPSPEDSWDDLYFRIWLNVIEPKLPADRAVFVCRYPASQAALSVLDRDPDGTLWAKRFELYAGGFELGNAFEELTDPVAQRQRFMDDMELRARTYGEEFPRSPIDEEFIHALEEGIPPSAGIAIGVDRLVMLAADEADIAYTRWLPSVARTEA